MDSIEQLCQQLAADPKAAFKARRAIGLQVAAVGAADKASERTALAAELAEQLVATKETKDRDRTVQSPSHPASVRNELARALADVGGDAQIPTLKQALSDFDIREMARFALDRTPGAAATAALIEAAQAAVGTEFRVGAINALGRRSGEDVVAALNQYAADSDGEVRLAAAEALANQPDEASDALFGKLATDFAGNARATKRLAIARVRLADSLARAGQKDAAKKIYEAAAAGADSPQKKAASEALKEAG